MSKTIYTIYKATNIKTDKVYVGFDSNWPERIHTHKMQHKKKKTKFYSAIIGYGWNTFAWDILYQSTNKEHTFNEMEQHFIQEYNSILNGYNMTEGGAGCLGVTKNTIWINNGKEHKRVLNTEIPVGWICGRIGLKRSIGMSESTKKIIGEKNKKHGHLTKLNSQIRPCPYCKILLNPGQYNRHIKVKHKSFLSLYYI